MATEILERAIASTRPIVAGLSADELDLPTPCRSWDVRALLNHLIGASFFSAARVEGVAGERPSEDFAGGEFLEAYDQGTRRALGAFRAPGALDRMVQLPFGELPAPAFLGIVATDQFVHGWDLAMATGRPGDFDQDLAAMLLERARVTLPKELRGPEGQAPFGHEQPASPDASAADQLAAFLGRTL